MDRKAKVSNSIFRELHQLLKINFLQIFFFLCCYSYCVTFQQKVTRVAEDGMSVKFWGNFKMTEGPVSWNLSSLFDFICLNYTYCLLD